LEREITTPGPEQTTSSADVPTAAGQSPDRRTLLKGAAALAAAGGLGTAAAGQDDPRHHRVDLFMPEEHWRDRMRAPDDGKRYGWVVDTRRCFGCHACEVAC
jgi:hypothetical protein